VVLSVQPMPRNARCRECVRHLSPPRTAVQAASGRLPYPRPRWSPISWHLASPRPPGAVLRRSGLNVVALQKPW